MWFSWERLPPAPKVFRGVLPRRWVVEPHSAWLCQNRRFSREHERLCSTSEALIYATIRRLMLRRLARKVCFQTVFSLGGPHRWSSEPAVGSLTSVRYLVGVAVGANV